MTTQAEASTIDSLDTAELLAALLADDLRAVRALLESRPDLRAPTRRTALHVIDGGGDPDTRLDEAPTSRSGRTPFTVPEAELIRRGTLARPSRLRLVAPLPAERAVVSRRQPVAPGPALLLDA